MLEKDVQKQIFDFLQLRGWRPFRTHPAYVAGQYSAGEPGCPDAQAIRYMPVEAAPARCIMFWIEFKGPRDRRVCACIVNLKGKKKICKVCRQKNWHARERERGAVVIQTSSLDAFAAWYETQFGWLHRDRPVIHKPQASLFEEQ